MFFIKFFANLSIMKLALLIVHYYSIIVFKKRESMLREMRKYTGSKKMIKIIPLEVCQQKILIKIRLNNLFGWPIII